MAGVPGRLLDCGAARQHNEVRQRNPFTAGLGRVKGLLDGLELFQNLGQFRRLMRFPVLLRRQAQTRPVGPPALVRAAEGRRRGPGGGHPLGDGEPRGEDLGLEGRDVPVIHQSMVHRRHRVLPDEFLGRYLGPQIAGARAHVAVGQLEPGAGEGIGEGLRVLVVAARDRLVEGVEAQGQVRRGHDGRVLAGGVMGVGNQVLLPDVLRHPLPGAGGALHQLPLIAEEHVEIAHVPAGRVRLPGSLDAAGDGVHPLTGPEGVLPAQAHLLEGRGLRRGADQGRVAGTMAFAKGVTAGHQGDGFLVVHGHAGEGFADVATGGHWVGVAIRAFGVDVDEAHLNRSQGVCQLPIAGVTALGLVAGRQPFGLGTPIDVVLRFPDILASATKAESLEAHGLEGAVAGQNQEIRPGDLVAVFLLDGPEEPPRLVQVGVIGPTVDGGETLITGAGAAAPIRDAVGARVVPSHADEEAAVVSPVGGPPVLGIRHQGMEVLLQRGQVELLEFLGIVELPAQGVGLGGVLVQDLEVEFVGPPVLIGLIADFGAGAVDSSKWALGFVGHGDLLRVIALPCG